MPEALVLVFSLQDASTLQTAQDACAGFDLEQVEVKLLCGTHADSLLAGGVEAANLETTAQPEWFHRALDWSIEHGFELVVCCPGAPGTDAALALDGDRQGVARVIEALHAHTWSNLALVEQQGEQLPAPDAAAAAGGGAADAAAAPSAAAAVRDAGAAGRPHEDSGSPATAVEPQRSGRTSGADQPEKLGEEGDGAEAERGLDGMERLMAEMRGHKERLGSLPDEERRAQAASIALRMLQVLGLEEDESSDDAG